MVARDIFKRLSAGRPPAAEEPAKQQLKNTDRVSRWKRKTDAEIFLKRVLTNGPMPATVIEELGAARKFSKRQLECAKQRIAATAFKKKGKLHGCWFWTLEPGTVRKPHSRYNPYLRDLSKKLGYRLQPIDKRPRPSRRT